MLLVVERCIHFKDEGNAKASASPDAAEGVKGVSLVKKVGFEKTNGATETVIAIEVVRHGHQIVKPVRGRNSAPLPEGTCVVAPSFAPIVDEGDHVKFMPEVTKSSGHFLDVDPLRVFGSGSVMIEYPHFLL